MKFIATLLVTLIAIVAVFGTIVVALANNPRLAQAQTQVAVAQSTPTQQPTPTQTDTETPGRVIYSGSDDQPTVALTFDDGPNPYYTSQILAVLQQYGVHATFFTIGEQVQAYPDLIQQEYAAGNVIGNHSWNHPDLTKLSANEVHSQLSTTADAIQQATGTRPTFFRPPYGAINNAVQAQATELGFTSTLWSVDTLDWQGPGKSAIINTVLTNVQNGSIILLHDGGGDRSQTVAALPTIITQLQARGYQLVTVQQIAAETQQASTTPTQPQALMELQLHNRPTLCTLLSDLNNA